MARRGSGLQWAGGAQAPAAASAFETPAKAAAPAPATTATGITEDDLIKGAPPSLALSHSLLRPSFRHTSCPIRAAFKRFDADGSGSVSEKELALILRRPAKGDKTYTFEESIAEAARVIKMCDVNGDGALDFEEFASWYVSTGGGALSTNASGVPGSLRRSFAPTHLTPARALELASIGESVSADIATLLETVTRVDVHAKTDAGDSLLYEAAAQGHTALASYLLDNGAEVNEGGADGRTPLHVASLRGFTDLFTVLRNHGADIDQPDRNGQSPLVAACEAGAVEAVRAAAQLEDVLARRHAAGGDGHAVETWQLDPALGAQGGERDQGAVEKGQPRLADELAEVDAEGGRDEGGRDEGGRRLAQAEGRGRPLPQVDAKGEREGGREAEEVAHWPTLGPLG